VVDVGIAGPHSGHPDVLQRRVRAGTANLAQGPALSLDEAARAVLVGMDVAGALIDGGADLLVGGEMGIGNTTPSAALIGAITGLPAAEVTGRGTGIDDATLARKTAVVAAALARLEEALDSGAALAVFHRMVAAQGGDLEAPRRIAVASEATAKDAGRVEAIDTEALGQAVIDLGGGRRKAGESIDPAVGLECLVRVGDRIETNQPLFRIFSDDAAKASSVAERLVAAVTVGERMTTLPLLIERVGALPDDDTVEEEGDDGDG
jgi:nicotinate-nucleotide--dimethylbenzimidazole phosphoribosyltransferase